jgi:hypothetical protein
VALAEKARVTERRSKVRRTRARPDKLRLAIMVVAGESGYTDPAGA